MELSHPWRSPLPAESCGQAIGLELEPRFISPAKGPSLAPKLPSEFNCPGNSSCLEVPGVKHSCFLHGQGYAVVTAFSKSVCSSPPGSSFPAAKGSAASEPLGHSPASRVPAEALKRLLQCYPPVSCVPFPAGSGECQP